MDVRNVRSLTCTSTMNTALPFLCHCYFRSLLDRNILIGNLFFEIHSFFSRSYDRSTGPSKANSPQSVIRCFHIQFLLYPRSLRAIQYPPTSPYSSSRHFCSSLYPSFDNVFQTKVTMQDVTNPISSVLNQKYLNFVLIFYLFNNSVSSGDYTISNG